jgi:hypothetical protein
MGEQAAASYDSDYFAWQTDTATQRAEAVLSEVLRIVSAASIIDVGCGSGVWLRTAQHLGVGTIDGVDGWDGELAFPADRFRRVDLNEPLPSDLGSTISRCRSKSPNTSSRATRPASWLISAGSPAQCSSRRRCPARSIRLRRICTPNEQWPSYWTALFHECGFRTLDLIRPKIWNDGPRRVVVPPERIPLLAVKADSPLTGDEVRDLVHPRMWETGHPVLWMRSTSPRALLRQLPGAVRRSLRG